VKDTGVHLRWPAERFYWAVLDAGPVPAALRTHTERTVRAIIARGDLRVVRFGRSVRIDPTDLRAFIDGAKRVRLAAERRCDLRPPPRRIVAYPPGRQGT
jgi:excisionase family DNA binding protein